MGGLGNRVPWDCFLPSLLPLSTRVSFFRSPSDPRAACRVLVAEGEVDGVKEVADEPLYLERVCGIDIGKAGMEACIRVLSRPRPPEDPRACAGTGGRGVL